MIRTKGESGEKDREAMEKGGKRQKMEIKVTEAWGKERSEDDRRKEDGTSGG